MWLVYKTQEDKCVVGVHVGTGVVVWGVSGSACVHVCVGVRIMVNPFYLLTEHYPT